MTPDERIIANAPKHYDRYKAHAIARQWPIPPYEDWLPGFLQVYGVAQPIVDVSRETIRIESSNMTTENSRADALTDGQILDVLKSVHPDAVRLPPGWLAFARAILAASPVEQPVAGTLDPRNVEHYRRGVREAFHFANMANANRQGRTPEETCTHIVAILARLVNGERLAAVRIDEPRYTQADMERYGKAYADARDTRRAAPAPVDERAAFNADDLDFEPDAQHTVADMANIGYALLEQIVRMAPAYHWNDSPVEIVSDLINERDEARAASASEKGAEMTKPVAWVHFRSDGGFEGPIMDSDERMCDVRRNSGAWTPLYRSPAMAAEAVATPAGWKLVPIVPTMEMCTAMERAVNRGHKNAVVWNAALAVSPKLSDI